MLRRLSKTLYIADDPAAVIQALTARGWRRARVEARHETARFTQGAAVIIVYENDEVAARGEAAIQMLYDLWR